MQKEFGINLPKRSNHAGIVFIRDFLTIIFIKKVYNKSMANNCHTFMYRRPAMKIENINGI